MSKKYDIHLSAYSISRESVQQFEDLGFERDLFANNTRCETTQYHGTYRGQIDLPDDSLWNKLCSIMNLETTFSGSLEEEIYDANATIYFDGKVENSKSVEKLPKIGITQPNISEYKACDIHININIDQSIQKTIEFLECLEIASFDREEEKQLHRIFTITCSTTSDGILILQTLKNYLRSIIGLVGKIKMEQTVRHLRLPINSPQLPLTNSTMVKDWINKTN